jgi:hypothetical protein
MGRTFVQPETQIATLDAFDDQVAAGAAMETTTFNLEQFLGAVISQINRLMHTTTAANNWYDDIATPGGGSKRGVNDLNTDLLDMENKRVLCRANLLTDVTVTAAQNWEILSVAGTEPPTEVAAVATTVNGAVVAQSALSGAGFNVHELTELAGPDALHPKNLCVVIDPSTGQQEQTAAGLDIFALLQYESTGVDGAAFNDISGGNRAKLSFVIHNGTHTDLIACPVAEIAGKTIRYQYSTRINLDALPEDCWLPILGFVDQSASVDVTRQNAYDNQGATSVDLTGNADLDLGAAVQWAIRDAANADLWNVTEGSAGGTTTITVGTDVDVYQNDAQDVDFNQGITVDEGGTPIDIGVTAGQIGTTGAADLTVDAGGELLLNDANFDAEATWAQAGVKVTETAAEVAAYETAFGGEVSLFNAIVQANSAAARSRADADCTVAVAANILIEGPGGPGAPNLSADLLDYDAKTFTSDVEVFINGLLQRPGANAAANHDVYPSAVSAERQVGAFYAEFKLKVGDNVSMFING